MRHAKRVHLSKALLGVQKDILRAWYRSLEAPRKLHSRKGSRTKDLLSAEMQTFLSHFLSDLQTGERSRCEHSLERMARLFFQVELPHTILAQIQISLKKILIREVIRKFTGRTLEIRDMCNYLESEIDKNRIFLADAFEKLALATLASSEKNYRELIEDMEDMVFRLNTEGKIIFANSACARILGSSAESLIGKSIAEYLEPEGAPDFSRTLEEVLSRRKKVEFLSEARSEKQERVILHFRMYPMEGKDGRIAGVRGIARDVSHMKEVTRMKSDFSSLVSHELRTPLTSLKNVVDILLSGKVGALDLRQSRLLSIAKKETGRLCELIANILDLSKLESGSTVLERAEIDVRELLESAMAQVGGLAGEKRIVLEARVARGLPKLRADPGRLEQIIVNLLSNAIRFSPSGEKVRVSARLVWNLPDWLPLARKLPAGWKASSVMHNGRGNGGSSSELPSGLSFVEISVRDRGIGISAERLDAIFDKYAQAHSVMTRTSTGIGLGLTITKHLTLAHNGLIWVESREGEGSVFRCLFLADGREAAFRGRGTGEPEQGVNELELDKT